jgi:hypothetical protein
MVGEGCLRGVGGRGGLLFVWEVGATYVHADVVAVLGLALAGY